MFSFDVFFCLLATIGLSQRQDLSDNCDVFLTHALDCYLILDISHVYLKAESLLSFYPLYVRYCGDRRMEEFLVCYEFAVSLCSRPQDIYPMVNDLISVRSVFSGLCENEEALTRGMNCAKNKSANFLAVTGRCFKNMLADVAMVQQTGNWPEFCRTWEDGVECLDVVLTYFGCGDEFTKGMTSWIYAIAPKQCRRLEDDKYRWIIKYGSEVSAGNSKTHNEFLCLVLIWTFVKYI